MAIVAAEVWRATAIVMLIIVAGLQLINKDYLETAELFGATLFQKLRMVILPLLKPSIQSALIIRTLFAVQVFAVVVTLGGGLVPVLASEAYMWQTEYYNPRVASVYALLIAAISVVLTAIYLKVLKPHVEVR